MSRCTPGPGGFHVLLGARGWGRGRWEGLLVDADGLRLAPAASHTLSATLAGRDLPPELDDADFALGRCGLLYLLLEGADGHRSLLTCDPRQARSESFPCLDPALLADPAAVAFFAPSGRAQGCGVAAKGPGGIGTLFLANLSGEHRILAVSELGGQIRWSVGPETDSAGRPLGLDVPLTPLDLAVDARGFLHALVPFGQTGSGTGSPGRWELAILVLDPGGRRVALWKLGAIGGPAGIVEPVPPPMFMPPVPAPPGILLRAAPGRLPLPPRPAGIWARILPPTFTAQLPGPFCLAVAPEGDLWVLDSAGRRLLHLSADGALLEPVPLAAPTGPPPFPGLPADFEPRSLALDREGNLYLGDGREAPPPGEEDTRFVHRFAPGLEESEGEGPRGLRYLGPIAGYRGQVRALAVDGEGRIFVFNREERRIAVLSPTTTLAGPGSTPTGIYHSPPLDSAEAGTRWHRLRLDLELPERTRVRLAWATLESPDDAAAYRAFLAGDAGGESPAWSEPVDNPRDTLVRAAPGRYLALRLELTGTATASPRVRRARADFPRTSLVSRLPAVYQQEAPADSFLERFLALFGAYFADAEGRIDTLVRRFDPRIADVVEGPWLTWLSGWLALAAEPGWPEETRRQLLLRAPELYRLRGTRAGIAALVEIFTGVRPLVVEKFQLRCAAGTELGTLYENLFGRDPTAFCVLLPPGSVANEEEGRALRRAIEGDAPAHTRAGVRVLPPRIVLGHHCYLGINTILPAPSPRLDTGAALPFDAVLTDLDEAGQIERRSRTGIDTTLT